MTPVQAPGPYLGKRRLAVLRVFAEHGRHTAADVLRLLDREHPGHGLAEESVRDVLVDLEDRGLIEPDDPHMDRFGRLRGTWRITEVGRAAFNDSTRGEGA